MSQRLRNLWTVVLGPSMPVDSAAIRRPRGPSFDDAPGDTPTRRIVSRIPFQANLFKLLDWG
jgi:hypothetical protein